MTDLRVSRTPIPAQARSVEVEYGPMVRIRNLSDNDLQWIMKGLTLPNPKHIQARRFSKFSHKHEEFFYGYRLDTDGSILVARGAFHTLIQGYLVPNSVHWQQRALPRFFSKMPVVDAHLRDYQARLVSEVNTRCGTIVGICGSGKTEMMLAIIHQRNVPALIIVDQHDILEQWFERILLRTGVKAVRVGGGRKKMPTAKDPYCIATVQTLCQSPQLIYELNKTRELVAVDECQGVPAKTFTEVLCLMDPYYLFGCTATPERADGLTKMIHWYCGPVVATVSREELEMQGITVRPELLIHETPFSGEYEPDRPGDYGAMLEELVNSALRLAYVVDRFASTYSQFDGSYHLIVSGRREYGRFIQEALAQLGISSALMTGADGKVYRREVLEEVRSGRCRVLIAPKLADKALDLPILTDVHLVFPQRSKGPLEQRIGRVCRSREGKSGARVHDYVDGGRLARQFKHRYYSVFRKICSVSPENQRIALRIIRSIPK